MVYYGRMAPHTFQPSAPPRTGHLILALPLLMLLSQPTGALAEEPDATSIFFLFTDHIARQIAVDKEQFATADVCTHWFYQQLRPKRGAPPVQPTADAADDCRTKYPDGIQGAREQLSRTQSWLSLSLTFYEFALVGDADDDGRYSDEELRDILQAFGFTLDDLTARPILVATLNNKFDSIHKFGGMEALMTGMGTLYEKGYRLTSHDREALDRIMG